MSTRALYRQRLLVLAEELRSERELPSERQVAMSMGLDPSYWARIRDEGVLPDTDQIDKVVKKVGLRFEFFTDPTLGDTPDYRGFVDDHVYPPDYPQAASDRQAWMYPADALGRFRAWLDEVYLPEKYPEYIKRKVKSGALPASRAELLLAATIPQLPEE